MSPRTRGDTTESHGTLQRWLDGACSLVSLEVEIEMRSLFYSLGKFDEAVHQGARSIIQPRPKSGEITKKGRSLQSVERGVHCRVNKAQACTSCEI